MKTKNIQVKIYDRDLTELALETKLVDTPTWNWETGKGQLDTTLKLNYPFDDLPSYIRSNNIVKIKEISPDNPRGVDAYMGVIGSITPYLEATDQGVEIEVLSPNTMLQWSHFLSGSATTVSYTDTDIADIFKDVINHWQTVHSSTLISYTASTISTTSVSVTLDIVDKKHGEALEEVFKYADADWFWYIDVDGLVYLQELPTVATHTFTIGKDVTVSKAPLDYKTILNKQTVFYNGGNVTITSSGSIASYGEHQGKYIRDDNIQNIGTATARATKEVVGNKHPKVTGTINVTSEFVNLPDIRVGDTVKIKNYNESGSILNDNMPVVGIQYNWDSASLEIGEIRSNFARQILNIIEQAQ